MPTLDSAVLYTNILPESRGDTLAVNLRVFAPGLGVDEDPVVSVSLLALLTSDRIGMGGRSGLLPRGRRAPRSRSRLRRRPRSQNHRRAPGLETRRRDEHPA
jgi:predicted PhzF superfamily epimerase YddE/YHI9